MSVRSCILSSIFFYLIFYSCVANSMTDQSNLPAGSIVLQHGKGEPSNTIIWLHGLGAGSNDFPPIVPELGLDPDRAIRFIFPQAPNRPVTINMGMRMPAWYDIYDLSRLDKQDRDGIEASRQAIDHLIDQQIHAGIVSQRIILVGFSQGGAMALYTGLRYGQRLAGIIALSSYLPSTGKTR